MNKPPLTAYIYNDVIENLYCHRLICFTTSVITNICYFKHVCKEVFLLQAYLEQIIEFKKNSHLDAVGVQSHFPRLTEPDPTLLKVPLHQFMTFPL